MMKVRWGILGTGRIAHSFAEGLASAPDAELLAVGSRVRQNAEAFAREFSVPRAYPAYEALARDADLDVIYVATPHAMHRENTMMCLAEGRSVLCEKPLAVSSREAAEMIEYAQSRRLFLMEGMWTFTFPAMQKALELARTGEIGKLRSVSTALGFIAGPQASSRLFSKELAGGALLDVGVYGVAVATRLAAGMPEELCARSHFAEHGVDETTAAVLRWREGPVASVVCSIGSPLSGAAWLGGSEGAVEIPAKFSQPDRLVVRKPGREDREIAFERAGNGYTFEAIEVMRCLSAGESESPQVPLRTSLETLQVCDRLRAAIGLRYPFEPQAPTGDTSRSAKAPENSRKDERRR